MPIKNESSLSQSVDSDVSIDKWTVLSGCWYTGLADPAWEALQGPESLVYTSDLWTDGVAGLPSASLGPGQAVCEASAIR